MDLYFLEKAILELNAALAEAEHHEAGDLVLGLITMARGLADDAAEAICDAEKARKAGADSTLN